MRPCSSNCSKQTWSALSCTPWWRTTGSSPSLAISGSNLSIRCQSLNGPYEKNADGLNSTLIYKNNTTCPSQEAPSGAHMTSLISMTLPEAVGSIGLFPTFCNPSEGGQFPCPTSCYPACSDWFITAWNCLSVLYIPSSFPLTGIKCLPFSLLLHFHPWHRSNGLATRIRPWGWQPTWNMSLYRTFVDGV